MAFFDPRVALAVLAMALTTACFDAPRPNCAFYCGTGAEACPDGYMCSPEDDRCHLVVSGGGLAQCEDTVPGPVDASLADASADATPADAGPDAAVSTHTGTISVSELTLAGAPTAGNGLSVSIDLTPVDPVAPAFDSQPGQPTGCKVHVYDKSAEPATQPPVVDRDHGTVKITGTGTPVPDCKFNMMKSVYECQAGNGLGAAITKGPMGTAVYTATGFTFTDDNTDHYIEISGATPASNNGRFPIFSVTGNTAVYVNPAAVTDASGSIFTLLAGQGPTPNGVAEPIGNDGPMITVSIDPAEGGAFDFPDINVTAGRPFTLDAASQAALTNLPFEDDEAFTFACETPPCPAATGSIVLITTSDGVLEGVSPFALPPVANKQVIARCAFVGGPGSVQIPKEVFDLIQASKPTRIRTLFFRAGLQQTGNPDGLNRVNVVAGHAIAGFTNKIYNCDGNEDCTDTNPCTNNEMCVSETCELSFVTPGTPLATQTDNDCKRSQCGDFGAIDIVADPADLPEDNKDCTIDVCNGQNPAHTNAGAGTGCNDDGGKVCDGDGNCVECNLGTDCASGVCGEDHTCQAPTCTDMVENGTETDIDCGGTCPLDCGDGKRCMLDTDCISKVCESMICQAPTCTDLTENGMETDVDCGGTCPLDCDNGEGCVNDSDCKSKVCDGMICQAPTCTDMTQNQGETDEDCGGMMCPACLDGQMCMVPTDCMSGNCDSNICAP